MPEELKKMMSRQASAEREKRATITKAEGDKEASRQPGRRRPDHGREPRRHAAPDPADDRRPRPDGLEHRGARRADRGHGVVPPHELAALQAGKGMPLPETA